MRYTAQARTGIAGHELLCGGLVDPGGTKLDHSWLKDGGDYKGDCADRCLLSDLAGPSKKFARFNLIATHLLNMGVSPEASCMYGGMAVRKVRANGFEYCEKGGRITRRKVE